MRFQRLPGGLSRRRQITRERPADDYVAEFVRHVSPRTAIKETAAMSHSFKPTDARVLVAAGPGGA
jgi:ABC-type proline/glycine betaine transport system ATPase subunit